MSVFLFIYFKVLCVTFLRTSGNSRKFKNIFLHKFYRLNIKDIKHNIQNSLNGF